MTAIVQPFGLELGTLFNPFNLPLFAFAYTYTFCYKLTVAGPGSEMTGRCRLLPDRHWTTRPRRQRILFLLLRAVANIVRPGMDGFRIEKGDRPVQIGFLPPAGKVWPMVSTGSSYFQFGRD